MNIIKTYFGLAVIQIIFITVIILAVTVIRFFDPVNFEELRKTYSTYALFDADTSLVYGEEE